MRIHNIWLKNYRGVSSCFVEFPETGVTVIEGDNEVGKTCIPEALQLILQFRDDSNHRHIKSIRPVHRDVGAEVHVELSTGNYHLKYFKRWHRDKQTTLEILKPRHEQLSGRQAHEKMETILVETLDQDLWSALSIQQGVGIGMPSFAGSSLGQALDVASGSLDISNDSEDDLWQRVAVEQEKYWTAKGQQKADRKKQIQDLDQISHSVAECKEQLRILEGNANAAERLQQDEVNLLKRSEQGAQDADNLNEQWQATETLRSHLERLSDAYQTCEANLKVAEEQQQKRQDLIAAVESHRNNRDKLQAEIEKLTPELALVTQRYQAAKATFESAQISFTKAQDTLRQANNDRDYLRNIIEKDQLAERYERIIEAQTTLKEVEALLDASEIDEGWLEQVEEANLQVVKDKAALSAASVLVETTALAPISASLGGQEVSLPSGEVRQVEITNVWTLEIPGTVHVKVQPSRNHQDLITALQRSQNHYDRLCQQGEVSNVEQARRRMAEQQDAKNRRATAVKSINENRRDLTPEVLLQKKQSLEKRVAEYPAQRSNGSPLPDDFEQAKQIASTAENAANQYRIAFESAQEILNKADQTSQASKVNQAAEAARLESAQSSYELAQQKLQQDRAVQADEALQEALAAATVKMHAGEAALYEATEKLQAHDPDTLKTKLDNANNVKIKAEKLLQANRERQVELRGWLEAQGQSGLHTQLNDLQSNYEYQKQKVQAAEVRASAVQLLHKIFQQKRQEARQRYVAPFKDRIEQLGRIVFGADFQIELDAELKPTKRTLDGITLDIEQLSVGAQEQFSVIARLACAAIVSPSGGGVPVVIDDALGWSDPSRLQAMGAAIATASSQSQVILLTCTPERYSHVGDATVIRLPASSISVSNQLVSNEIATNTSSNSNPATSAAQRSDSVELP